MTSQGCCAQHRGWPPSPTPTESREGNSPWWPLKRRAGKAGSQVGQAGRRAGGRAFCGLSGLFALLSPPWKHRDLCLFWQGRESQDTQGKPLNLLTVWDWSVQFEPKAQTLLKNPLYVEKPKLDKGQRKGTHLKVRHACT